MISSATQPDADLILTMRLPSLFPVLLAAASLVSADAASTERTAAIYIQPVQAAPITPAPLVEVRYNTATPAHTDSQSEIVSFEAPELPENAKLVRIGVYDPEASHWVSSTTVASVENFARGYSPHFILSVTQEGDAVSASVRGVRVDAGQTRDFGPQVLIQVDEKGRQPDLNQPVVLKPDGKKAGEPEEKSFFQKYRCPTAMPFVVEFIANFCPQVLVDDGHFPPCHNAWRRWGREIIDSFNVYLSTHFSSNCCL